MALTLAIDRTRTCAGGGLEPSKLGGASADVRLTRSDVGFDLDLGLFAFACAGTPLSRQKNTTANIRSCLF